MIALWTVAALLSGSSVGLLGMWLVGLRMPFLGIGMAHAAMAGAVLGHLVGCPPEAMALVCAVASGGLMAWLATASTRTDLGTITSILLSLTMALAFIGIGLNKGEMSPLLAMLWGSILFVSPLDVGTLAGLVILLALFGILFGTRLNALIFSRPLARACGLYERQVLEVFMIVAAVTISLNLRIVGGLLMYSLLTNPAAAAFELGRSMRTVLVLSVVFGVGSAVGGLLLSYLGDLPTGASIVLVSTLIYAVVAVAARHANRGACAFREGLF